MMSDMTEVTVTVGKAGSWNTEDKLECVRIVIPCEPAELSTDEVEKVIYGVASSVGKAAIAYFGSQKHALAVEQREEKDKKYWSDRAGVLQEEKKELEERLSKIESAVVEGEGESDD